MKQFKWSLLLVLLFVLIGLVACSNDESGSTPVDSDDNSDSAEETDADTEEASGEVDLRVVTTMAGTDPAGEVFQEVLDEFVSENPHVTIENDSQSADAGTIRTKVNTDFSSDNEPDIMFYFNTIDAEGIIEEGKVVNLEEAEDIDLSGFNSMLEQQRHSDGNIYAAPQSGFYEGLFVNEKLFEEQGIELPTTWEKYEAAIKAFAETDIVPIAASTEDSYYVVEHYALAAGGMENYSAELADQNPAWAEGLDNIKKHADMGAFTPDAATIDLAMAQELFKQEQAAMIFEGSWLWGQLEEAEMGEDVTVLPMPVYADGGETGEIVGGASQGWFISTKSYEDEARHDAVVDLFNYLTSEEVIVRIAGATGQPPAKGALEGLPAYLEGGHQLISDAPAVALPINDRIYPEAFTHMRTSVPEIVSGNKTGEQVLQEAVEMEE
ncbi:raffinose/stachyose/melibiose transport system substrate-binding protein [Gracilibacillus orientalis]|uniref:Raffinose/stachyose/melibiose transport system substrate-binding protein n=1 Tax=Gracilibacillus orientalis TaxID=334253 RepID=A0A1I4HJX1_9BACI|nr:extracellular solute-binding protein [Gracilibacillus orientalis]SFL42485.1 raffinose/stachyose/melibiose transport system substrate-binding protein [Gracilibacillus orientalis]